MTYVFGPIWRLFNHFSTGCYGILLLQSQDSTLKIETNFRGGSMLLSSKEKREVLMNQWKQLVACHAAIENQFLEFPWDNDEIYFPQKTDGIVFYWGMNIDDNFLEERKSGFEGIAHHYMQERIPFTDFNIDSVESARKDCATANFMLEKTDGKVICWGMHIDDNFLEERKSGFEGKAHHYMQKMILNTGLFTDIVEIACMDYATKLFIREAGIQKEKLTIALEPEVASIFCQKLKTDRVEDTTDFTEAVPWGMQRVFIYHGDIIPEVQTCIYGTLMQQSSRVLPMQNIKESAQHSMIETIIAANRSFLIEEINTMTLVRAFKDVGITCFDGLDGTLGRQQRAESFLTILEENNLLDQLFDILCEQGMTCVLDRLNNCRSAYSADAQILKRNISSNLENIIDNLDIDDVREMFIEREVFSSSMFHEIEDKYSESRVQMFAMLIEILRSEPRAGRLLVDVLYINQLDSLADSLLKGTQIELQEMKDNTQTDESSSDGKLCSV